MFWRPTCAAAPATRTSSRRSVPPRPRCAPPEWESRSVPDDSDKFVGRSVTRLEDRPLLLGQGRFAADMNFPDQLHMRVVRSSHANARLLSIDAAAARATPGVHAVWTAADVADIPPIDFRLSKIAGLDGYRQRVLATDRVRYVGEPFAVVFAEDPYLAEDVADQVLLEGGGTAGAAARGSGGRRIRAGPLDRRGRCPQGIRRPGCGVPQRLCDRGAGVERRAPFRRAARDPRRDRAL